MDRGLRTICLALAAFFALHSVAAARCEKWKSEMFRLASATTGYAKIYVDYTSGKLEEARFSKKKQKTVDKIKALRSYVESAKPCDHADDKFEKRQEVLLSWSSKILDLINENEEVASELARQIKDDFFSK